MRWTTLILIVFSATLLDVQQSMAAEVDPALAKVCKKIVVLGGNIVYKFQASGHLARTDRSASCSFIYGPGNCYYTHRSFLPIYDSKGKKVSTFVAYELGGYPYPARWYTHGPSCSQVANSAKKHSRSYAGFIQLDNKTCLKVNDLRQRQGSPVPANGAPRCR
jgi:hypothetical protein